MAVIVERTTSCPQELSAFGDKSSAKKLFVVEIDFTSEDETTVAALVNATAPLTYLGFDKKKVSIEPQEGGVFYATVDYDSRDQQKPGTNAFSFDTTGSTEKIFYSRKSIINYNTEGATNLADDYAGGINVNAHTVEGVDIKTRKFSLEASQTYALTDITGDLIGSIHRLTGTVNGFLWTPLIQGILFTFYPGEVLFDGARGSVKEDGNVQITYKFDCSLSVDDPDVDNPPEARNGNAFMVGDIQVTQKNGWDYLWVAYEQEPAGASSVIQKAIAVYIEQVYEYVDFTDPFTTLGF